MRETVEKPVPQKALRFLYNSRFGSLFMRMVTRRWVSKLVGAYLGSRLSRHRIKRYIKKNGVNMDDYEEEKYKSFNAFFTRRIKPELRPFDFAPDALVSPCDAVMQAFTVTEDCTFDIKGFTYDVKTLLKDEALAGKYADGTLLIFRLSANDYHHYFFIDGGTAKDNKFIKGRLHTVQPIALCKRRVFTENCREVTVLETDHFGVVTQVEVGALMIGRISNEVKEGRFERGQEKGKFEFGGSTIALLFEKDTVSVDREFWDNTKEDKETVVRCGEKIGTTFEGL